MRNTGYQLIYTGLEIEHYLLQNPAETKCVTASKKKKLVNKEILASITASAAIMSSRAMIFRTRTALRITYPGPARDSFRKDIMVDLNHEQALERWI